MMLRSDLLLALTRLDSCDDSRAWLDTTTAPTFADVWQACPRGDWLLWLAGRLPGLEAQVGRATAAVAHLALAAITDEHPGAGYLREIVTTSAEVAESGGKSGDLHDRAHVLFCYSDGLESQIGDLGCLLSDLEPSSAYEIAWCVGLLLGDETAGHTTAEAVRSVLGTEEVEEALEAFLRGNL